MPKVNRPVLNLMFAERPYQLWHSDCLEMLGQIPSHSVDMVLADPPYGTTGLGWDSLIDLTLLWGQLERIIVPRGAIVLHSAQPFTTALINAKPDWFKYCWIWVKTTHGDIFNAKNKPMRQHEDICVFSEGTTANKSERKMPYYPQGLRSCLTAKGKDTTARAFTGPRPSHPDRHVSKQTNYPTTVLKFKNEQGYHPTQKPVPLLSYLIRSYTTEDQIVLDFTMGSGSTGVAALRTKRRFLGCDSDLAYFAVAQQRIEDEYQYNLDQSGLFD